MKKRVSFLGKLWLVLEPGLVIWHNSCCHAPEHALVMPLLPSRWNNIPYHLPLMPTGCKGTVNVLTKQLEGLWGHLGHMLQICFRWGKSIFRQGMAAGTATVNLPRCANIMYSRTCSGSAPHQK